MNQEKKFARNRFFALFEEITHYYKAAVITVIVGAITGGIIYFYLVYQTHREQKAHKALVECMKYFDASISKKDEESETLDLDTISFSSSEEKWNKVVALFEKAYQENSSSYLAPFFLTFKSEAFLHLKNLPGAIVTLESAVKDIKDTSLQKLYSLKLALLKLDSTATNADREQGFNLLKTLAEDSHNPIHDQALYYLGEHFWNERNFDFAKNYWNQLLLTYGPDSKNPSPWSEKAREKLKRISNK